MRSNGVTLPTDNSHRKAENTSCTWNNSDSCNEVSSSQGSFFTSLPLASCSESSYTTAPAEPIHLFSYLISHYWISNAGPHNARQELSLTERHSSPLACALSQWYLDRGLWSALLPQGRCRNEVNIPVILPQLSHKHAVSTGFPWSAVKGLQESTGEGGSWAKHTQKSVIGMWG